MGYRALALGVVALHCAYLLFLPFGGFLAWRWPRVVPFHLAALAVAAASVTVRFDCPLTTAQDALERRAGGHPSGEFIDRYVVGHVLPAGHDRAIQLAVLGLVVVSYAVMLQRRARRDAPTRAGPDVAPGCETPRGRTPTSPR